MLNTMVAESLRQFADALEGRKMWKRLQESLCAKLTLPISVSSLTEITTRRMGEGGGIRGLLNLKTTVDALPYFTAEKNVELFEKHKVFTRLELEARQSILYEEYYKNVT